MRYTDQNGCAPTRIQVVVVGIGRFGLSGGTTYQAGVTFSVGLKLPAGRWAYRFVASSGSGTGARSVTLTAVSPSRVLIVKPKPKPAPKPAPKPTPRPSAKPAARPKPRATPTASAPPAAPSSESPAAGGSSGGAARTEDPSPTSSPGPGALAAGDRGPAGGPEGPALSGGTSLTGPTLDPAVLLAVEVWSLTSALGVLLFALVLRRLAPGDPTPVRSRRWSWFRSAPRSAGATSGSAGAAANPTSPDDASLPRWLRPSPRTERLAAERVAPFETREPTRFTTPPRMGVVRSTVAYRLVRLTDGPDDHASVEIGRLDRGDEVEVIDDREGYLKVRTPTGLEGWVPRMVLVG